MNNYIFDWEENCENILKTKQCTTKNRQSREIRILFRYLMDKGYSRDAIFDIWIGLDTKVTNMARGDKDEENFQFGKIYSESAKWKMPKSAKHPIIIYQDEIDTINSYDVPPWLKEYLLALLACYKYEGQEWMAINQIRKFCFSVSRAKKEREQHAPVICECLNKYNVYSVNTIANNIVVKFNILSETKDNIAINIQSPNLIMNYFDKLQHTKICSICGAKFNIKNFNSKRCYCDSCQISQRKYHAKLRIRKYRVTPR